MKIISLNVGRPRLVVWNGQTVSTGIFKSPVEGRTMLRALNLDGGSAAAVVAGGERLNTPRSDEGEDLDDSSLSVTAFRFG